MQGSLEAFAVGADGAPSAFAAGAADGPATINARKKYKCNDVTDGAQRLPGLAQALLLLASSSEHGLKQT